MNMQIFDYKKLTLTQRSLVEVFGLKSEKKLNAYVEANSPHKPIVNDNYIFQMKVLQFLIFWWAREDHKPLLLWGHTGTGKTSVFLQFFARLNIPVFRQEVNGYSRFEDWVGYMGINEKGQTEFQYGSLTLAMKYGGIFMIEEADKLDNAVASALHGVLDGQPLVISENGGEIIYPHQNFRIVATANSNGSGDNTGLYPESKIQDVAYMARYLALKVGYMSPETEKKILKKAIGDSIADDTLDKMLKFAGEVREVFISNSMEKKNKVRITMEIRSLIDWAQMTVDCAGVAKQEVSPLAYALEGVMMSKASEGDRDKLETWYQRVFGTVYQEDLCPPDKEEV